jgi:hypothetical protein
VSDRKRRDVTVFDWCKIKIYEIAEAQHEPGIVFIC